MDNVSYSWNINENEQRCISRYGARLSGEVWLNLIAINDELKEQKTDFRKLESDLAISRNVNDKLTKQLILLERKCWANGQYSRRECLEISGMPESIQDDDLEDCILKIFNECDTPVDPPNIEACHWLKSKARPNNVITKLSKRKDVFSILKRKKKLKSVDITKVGLPQESSVFINQSLCSYYKYLWSFCKRLHSKKLLHSFWVSNSNVSLKNRQNTLVMLVSHVSDLEKHFDIKGLIGEQKINFLAIWLFFFLLGYCKYLEASFERCSKKSTREIYKLP